MTVVCTGINLGWKGLTPYSQTPYTTEQVSTVYRNGTRNLSSEGCIRSWIVLRDERDNNAVELRPVSHGGDYTRLNEVDI